MNVRVLFLSVAAALSSMVATGSYAAEATAEKASAPTGTHESRSAERKKNRAAMKEASKKGEVPKTGEASATPAASGASGTHATRSAERKKNRAALAEANKRGEVPQTNEAGAAKK